MAEEQILIRLRAIDEATQTINRVSKNLQTLKVPNLSKNLGKTKVTITNTIRPAQMMATSMNDLNAMAKTAGVSVRSFNHILDQNGMRFVNGMGIIDKYTGNVVDYTKATRMAAMQTKRFRFEFLSLLFFGMFLQRTFKRLTISTTTFFMKVTEGQTEAGQGITRLSASWQFLKFTIGDAIASTLLPLIPTLTDVIEKIADWIEQNPKLASTISISGVILGGFLLIVGTLYLGLKGLGSVLGSVRVGFAALGSPITLIAGLITLLIAIIPDARNAFMDMLKALIGAIGSLGNALLSLAKGDFELFRLYGEKALLQLALAFTKLVDVVFEVAAQVASAIVGLILTPLYALAKVVDTLLEKLGLQARFARRIADIILNITDSIANAPARISISPFIEEGIADVETRIRAVQETREQANQNQTNTINIENMNVTSENAEDLAEQLFDLIKSQGGNIRASNL